MLIVASSQALSRDTKSKHIPKQAQGVAVTDMGCKILFDQDNKGADHQHVSVSRENKDKTMYDSPECEASSVT